MRVLVTRAQFENAFGGVKGSGTATPIVFTTRNDAGGPEALCASPTGRGASNGTTAAVAEPSCRTLEEQSRMGNHASVGRPRTSNPAWRLMDATFFKLEVAYLAKHASTLVVDVLFCRRTQDE